MNCYFQEGEVFVWVKDRDYTSENMKITLKMLTESHRSGEKQGMIAQDVHTGKKYFVKVLFCNHFDQVFVEKESKVQLYSPYIIRIYGGMLDEKNKRFVTVAEYIPEYDLSNLIRMEGLQGDNWTERLHTCHRIALKFLRGIQYYTSVYEEDPIVHRDLKPENVMVSKDGRIVKIVDFDWVHLHESTMTVMNRREQKGTPGYADPKYWNSYICKKTMDIYSAGLVLYFLYTGHHHFYGSEEIQRYMVGDDYAYRLKEMPGIDEELKQIISGMIAREEERYHDIEDVITDIEAYLKKNNAMPDLEELLDGEEDRDVIRFTYQIGDIRYSPYVKKNRFIPILFGTKQERSQNGRMSGHILSFYRIGDKMKAIVLHEDCHPVAIQDEKQVSKGDRYSYAGTSIEVIDIRNL